MLSTSCLLWTTVAAAQAIDTTIVDSKIITRGQAVDAIVKSFDLKNKNRPFIKSCLKVPDECFFEFSARSNYDEIRFKPLILYPDVFPAYKYYDAVNIATMLGLVRGFEQDKSPFKPLEPITTIQAIKVVLGAAGQMKWKDKFEIEPEEQKSAVDYLASPLFNELKNSPKIIDFGINLNDYSAKDAAEWMMEDSQINQDSWWQWRYLAFALKAGIIDVKQALNSDSPITGEDLYQMITKTVEFQKNSKSDTAVQ